MTERSISASELRETVRANYAARAQQVSEQAMGCGDPGCGGGTGASDPITGNLYSSGEAAIIPVQALQASNPTALADLLPGETVLDQGSGGGIDVLLSAQRVGPTGFVYGLDMTDAMLALAEQNRQRAGARNVQFLPGEIEAIPLPDAAVDVIISNCVINLAADKAKVLREAFRVLRPGGRLAVSDVVAQGALPDDLRADMDAWVGCVAGALEEQEYRSLLAEAGFHDVTLDVTRVYDPRDLAESMESGASCCGAPQEWDQSAYGRFEAAGGRLVSAFIRASRRA